MVEEMHRCQEEASRKGSKGGQQVSPPSPNLNLLPWNPGEDLLSQWREGEGDKADFSGCRSRAEPKAAQRQVRNYCGRDTRIYRTKLHRLFLWPGQGGEDRQDNSLLQENQCEAELTHLFTHSHAILLWLKIVSVASAASIYKANALFLVHVEVPTRHHSPAGTGHRLLGADSCVEMVKASAGGKHSFAKLGQHQRWL